MDGERLFTVILRDISEKKANEEARLLAREVDHRAKNILAIVSSLIELTKAPTLAGYAKSLSGRIAAMSRAHALLSGERWKGALLGRLVEEELLACAHPEQFDMSEQELMLSSRGVQPASMLVHELATNATKYGAPSAPKGHVVIRWTLLPDGGLQLRWRKCGGPAVIPPETNGFGTTLIWQIIERQLGGHYQMEWRRFGLRCEALLPDTILQPSPPAALEDEGDETGATAADEPAEDPAGRMSRSSMSTWVACWSSRSPGHCAGPESRSSSAPAMRDVGYSWESWAARSFATRNRATDRRCLPRCRACRPRSSDQRRGCRN